MKKYTLEITLIVDPPENGDYDDFMQEVMYDTQADMRCTDGIIEIADMQIIENK